MAQRFISMPEGKLEPKKAVFTHALQAHSANWYERTDGPYSICSYETIIHLGRWNYKGVYKDLFAAYNGDDNNSLSMFLGHKGSEFI